MPQEPADERRRSSLLRADGSTRGRVGMVELFFDLVFVFAITQLSHTLLAHLDGTTVVQVGLLLVAVWWLWIFTTWVTNWLDPETATVRAALFALMLLGLLLSASIPQAFGTRGMVFACAYVAMQVGRTLFFLWAVRHEPPEMRRNFQRIGVWLSVAGVLWIVGGFAEPSERLAWWAAALAIEFISPAVYFWVPGLGRSRLSDWNVDGGHMAERCGLFVIIALGESLLVSGATFAAATWNVPVVLGFGCAFGGAVVMWWLYFDRGAVAGHNRIAHAADPGRTARIAYTYLHLPIVAGIILSAVADELVLAHPEHLSAAGLAMAIGGPALYLVGVGAFKWVGRARALPPLSHLVGLALLALVAPAAIGFHWSAAAVAATVLAILVLVAAWEHLSLRTLPSHT
jgi:low temperature requirement protein LtrA